MKMDASKFKKVSSDAEKTVLMHPRGHKIIIAHAPLDKTTVKLLGDIPPMYAEQGAGTDFSNVNNMPKMADGGGVGDQNHPMWHGVKSKIADWAGNGNPGLQTELPQDMKGRSSETYTDPQAPMSEEDWRNANGPVDSTPLARGGKVKYYADGTQDGTVSAADRTASAQKLGIAKYLPAIDAAPVPSNQADPSTQGAVGPPSVGSQPYALPQGMSDLSQGYETQLGGIQKQQQGAALGAQANTDLANQQATTLGAGVNQTSQINNLFTQHYNDLQNQRQILMQEMNSGAQHLDPQRFIKNMSTGDRILSGIGLVMGGIGAGMTHGPNLAAQFLQNNIDRDIDNQRLQMGVKQNLLNFNFQQTKDLKDAADFTKLNTMDMVSMNLKRQAAMAQGPLQQSALLNQAGILDQNAGQLQNQIAIQRTFRQLGSGQGGNTPEGTFQAQNAMLRQMGPQGETLAKDRESKHIPGMPGQASTPLAEGDKGSYEEMQNLAKNFQDAQDFLSKSGTIGAIMPGSRAYAQGLMNNMTLSIGKLEDLNRFTHEEGTTYRQMIPDLTGTHFTNQDQGRLNALGQALSNKMQTFKQVHGYDQNAQTPAESAPKQASSNEVERTTKDGKVAIFDGQTKKFLRYK